MRVVLVALALVAGCAGRSAAPPPVPPPVAGRVSAVARVHDQTGEVLPVVVAITNGRAASLQLDPRQLYALGADGARFAPLPPPEAARRAGGRRLPGGVRGGVIGAASGGALGAIGGAISGAIQGGIGAAVAVGAAAGAGVGAVVGVLSGGGGSAPDVAGFSDRALPATVLAPGLSATGYVYYPPGRYTALELLVPPDGGGAPERVHIELEPES